MIITVIIVGLLGGGLFYFWQQKNDVATNGSSIQQPINSNKTSLGLMKELVVKEYPNAVVENCKIFKEVKSPYSEKIAVLFGLDIEKNPECCTKPIGLFINNQGNLGGEYDILQGALQHLYLDNVRWQDDKTVLYDFVISDEGGKQATQKSITVE